MSNNSNDSKKYISLARLSKFLDNLTNKFAALSHKHTISDLTDYTVDTSLSPTSNNPVSNAVLDAEFEAISQGMGALEQAIDDKADASHNHDDIYYTKAQVDSDFQEKIYQQNDEPDDAEDGALWLDLDAEGSYNGNNGAGGNSVGLDTTLTQSGYAADAKAVGDRITESVDGLATEDYVDGKVAGLATETFVTNKISEAQLSGDGNIDLSGYATKDDLNNKIDKTQIDTTLAVSGKVADAKAVGDRIANSVSGLATEDYVNNKGYATQTYVNNKVSGLATEAFVTNKIAEAELSGGNGDTIDLSGYATKDELNGLVTEDELNIGLSGKANTSHNHSASNITSGTLPITRGGTGATSAATALTNLGAAAASHTHSEYANQNAFSNVKVGTTTISADTTTDTLTLVAGDNVTITPNSTSDSITITATDTVYTHPTTAGNKHIPSGGSTGQILRWSSSGTATWGNENTSTTTLSDLGITATATELNKLDGVTATTTELNYVDGVTSNIQTQLDGKAASSHGTHVSFTTTAPKAAGTASVGTASTVSRSDHVHPAQTSVTGNAGTATTLETTRTIDGVQFNGGANVTRYATCGTAAGTAAKTASITAGTFSLATGARVTVKFTYANTASSPTLNIGSTGAKTIRWRGATLTSGQYWAAGQVVDFVYDGTYWNMIGAANDNSGSGGASSLSDLGVTATATELNYVDGVTSNIQTQLNGKMGTSGDQTLTNGNLTLSGNGSLIIDDKNNAGYGIRVNRTASGNVYSTAIAGAAGSSNIYYYENGTMSNYINMTSSATNIYKPVTIASGGTGATTAAGALTNLGITPTASKINSVVGKLAAPDSHIFSGGTLAQLRTALDNWLASNNYPNAVTKFTAADNFDSIWNVGNTSASIGNGNSWTVRVIGYYGSNSYVMLEIASYAGAAFHTWKYNGTWYNMHRISYTSSTYVSTPQCNFVSILSYADDLGICPLNTTTFLRFFQPTDGPESNTDYYARITKLNDNAYITVELTQCGTGRKFVNYKDSTWKGWNWRYTMDYGTSLPAAGHAGRIFFKKV
jgi:hypothetical protein